MDEPKSQTTVTPHSQTPFVTRTYPREPELDGLIQRSAKAQKEWVRVPLQARIAIGRKFMVSLLFKPNPVPINHLCSGRVQEDER